jgi:predicted PurR-regulated permease PerM
MKTTDSVPSASAAAPASPSGFEARVRLACTVLLLVGCFLVLRPFLTAMLCAAVLCVTTWPLFVRLRALVRGHASLASCLMILLMLAIVILPLTLVAGSFAADAGRLVDLARSSLEEGLPPPPAWVAQIPFVGASAEQKWRGVVENREEFIALVRSVMDPARDALVALGGILAQGVFQMWLVAFIVFFFYRDGDNLAAMLRTGSYKVAENLSTDLLATAHGTMTSVVYGILGTAAAQALLALVGLMIAGVPAALALAVATFFLSLIPIGPPLVWGGAAVWLYLQGNLGWAIFMVVWGMVVVSGVDNVLKPFLISRGSNLSLLMVALGVFGGVLAFGFVGIFVGPVLLAVVTTALHFWLGRNGTAETAAASPTT